MKSTKSYKVSKLLEKGLTVSEVVTRLKVSRSMVYKVRGEMVEDGLLDIISLQPTGLKAPIPRLKPKPVQVSVQIQEEVKPKTLWQSIKEWFK